MTDRFDPFVTPIGEVEDVLLVAASAGTGKTWLISHLAARWLLEEGGEPDRLLIVTFSRAAAAELHHQLRARLVQVRTEWDGGRTEGASDEWRAWAALVSERLGATRAQRRVHELLGALDAVHARTIHSFAAAARDEVEPAADAEHLRVRAAREELVARATAPGTSLEELLAPLETTSTRAAARLAERITDALAATESAGGLASGRVTLLPPDDGSSERRELAAVLTASARRLARLRAGAPPSFDDLIADLHAEVSLPGSPLAQRLRDRFRFVLIDEFQDTDLLQWEVFDRVFRRGTPRAPLVLVGDPKQSIYGFRGGDVTVYERVRAEIAAGGERRDHTLDLTINHRSNEGLLRPLDAMWRAGASSDAFTFGDPGASVEYVPVTSSAHRRGEPGLFVVRRPDDDERAPEPQRDADVAAVVAELLTTHHAAPADVAILCRTRRTVDQLRATLQRHHIPTAPVGGTSVFRSPAARQLRTLLWALADPSDPRRARLLGATWFDLLADDLTAVAERATTYGVAALARSVRDTVTERAATGALSERDFTDLEHLMDLLSAAFHGPAAPTELARFLAARADRTDADATAAERRIESDRDAVRLLTIHRSKGLQFPIVLAPELEIGAGRSRVASWPTATGRALDVKSVLTGRSELDEPRDRDEAEARRLIYVALTRAERVLVAWVKPGGQFDALLRAVPEDEGPVRLGFGAPLPVSPGTIEAEGARPAVRRPTLAPRRPTIDYRLRRWSYSAVRLPGATAAPDDAADALDGALRAAGVTDATSDRADRTLFDGLAGAQLGSAVHRALELTLSGDEPLESAVTRAWRESSLGEPGPMTRDAMARIVERPLAALGGRTLASFAGTTDCATELRFLLPLRPGDGALHRVAAHVARTEPDGPFAPFFRDLAGHTAHDDQLGRGFLTGALDLVAALGDGPRYVVVDYKTNLQPAGAGYGPDALAPAMAEAGYPLQALLYLVALHRFLRGRVPDYDPARHLGGAAYLFVRGLADPTSPGDGTFLWQPPAALVAGASDLLDGRAP